MAKKTLTSAGYSTNIHRSLPDQPTNTPEELKQLFDSPNENQKDYNNLTLLVELASEILGESGAHAIGLGITQYSADNVADALIQVRQQIDDLIAGEVADGSITNAKLATDNKVGSLASLTTAQKLNLVSAINELVGRIDSNDTDIATKLPKDGSEAMSGPLILPNNIAVRGELTGGGDKSVGFVDSSDRIVLGSSTQPTNLIGTNLTYNNSNTIYHSGNLTPSDYLPKAGGIMTGAQVFENNININAKETGGTERNVAVMGSDNNMYYGSSTNGTVLQGASLTAAIAGGASSRVSLDKGKKTVTLLANNWIEQPTRDYRWYYGVVDLDYVANDNVDFRVGFGAADADAFYESIDMAEDSVMANTIYPLDNGVIYFLSKSQPTSNIILQYVIEK